MPKQPSDYPVIALRPDEWLEEQVTKRSSEKLASGQVAKRDLSRWYATLRLALPKFNREEALVLIETLRLADLKPETAYLLPAVVSASPDVVDEELDADFLEHLRNLHVVEYMAIIDAVERYWQMDSSQSVEARLQQTGLLQ